MPWSISSPHSPGIRQESAMATAELVLDCKAILGESPVGLPDGTVALVDINGKKILRFDSVKGAELPALRTSQMVGCIVPRASTGGFVAGLEDCIAHIPVDPSGPAEAAPHEVLLALPDNHCGPKKRCNDGKCDPQGRFWVGTMHASWRDASAPRGALFSLQPTAESDSDAEGLTLVERVGNTTLANGLAWSGDAARMFFIDSALRRVDCFDFDKGSGHVSNRRTVVIFADSEPGVPDGMAIDATGKLWVVIGESGSVRQMDPETGTEVSRVKLPVQRPTSCAFGGKDLSELYITTREETGPSPNPHAGGLFKVAIPGVKGPAFADPFAW